MKKRCWVSLVAGLWMCIFLPTAYPAPCTPKPIDTLFGEVPPIGRKAPNWCWAASAQMVMSNMHVDVSQCVQANDAFHPTNSDCCKEPLSVSCDQPGYPLLTNYDFSFTSNYGRGPLKWTEVQDQISCKRKPIICDWENGGSGHFFVVIGYNDLKQVEVLNPVYTTNEAQEATHIFLDFETYRLGDTSSGWHHVEELFDITKTSASAVSTSAGPPGGTPAETTQPETSANTVASLNEVTRSAAEALPTFSRIATPQNYQSLGFKSINEIKPAVLDIPLVVYHVNPDDLRYYKREKDPNTLLMDSGKVFFPVLVDGEVRTSIVMAKRKEGWRAIMFGNAETAQSLAATRKAAYCKADKVAFKDIFAVEVPPVSWNIYFIGYRMSNKLRLIPVVSDQVSALKLTGGEPVDAANVFEALAPLVRTYKRPAAAVAPKKAAREK